MTKQKVAYFSMEIMLESDIPTYSGGLGALAGDTILSAADMKVPLVAVTLLYRKGYLKQQLDPSGQQSELAVDWQPESQLEALPARVSVTIENRTVWLRAFSYQVTGRNGARVPVLFLDSDLPDNSDWDRTLTDQLYGGDNYYRLCQEVILGIGGLRMLRALGYTTLERFHMNEGHAALLTLELLDEELQKTGRDQISLQDIESVRQRCVFTTHTPVPAGHDQFPRNMVQQVLGPLKQLAEVENRLILDLASQVMVQSQGQFDLRHVPAEESALNMTYLALNLSHYVNGVAKKHGEVSRMMFADYAIDAITNGVHCRWVSKPMQTLFDRHLPDWHNDNFSLRGALHIPKNELQNAHAQNKKALLDEVEKQTDLQLDPEVLTIGFARRATPYKRADLIFTDLDKLKHLTNNGPLQLVFAGSAHPKDNAGKALIQHIFQAKEALKDDLTVVYLEGYDMALAQLLTAGVDLWLNTPAPPNEASGTSGMKAAFNGVPSLSILDGWWLEGHIEGMTGWAIGARTARNTEAVRDQDAASLYHQLEYNIMPMFYQERDRYSDVMAHAIALNGSFFNTQRMLQQYVLRAYFE